MMSSVQIVAMMTIAGKCNAVKCNYCCNEDNLLSFWSIFELSLLEDL